MGEQKGTVTRIVRTRGFGFIRKSDGTELFFHFSALPSGEFERLVEGQAVTFQTGRSPKGPRAENVVPR